MMKEGFVRDDEWLDQKGELAKIFFCVCVTFYNGLH